MTEPKRLLAVDLGDRRTGLAATDWTGSILVPLEPIVAHDDATVLAAIVTVARDRSTEHIVVGLPLGREGAASPRARRTLSFVERLRAAAPCPVSVTDESMTTDEAHERLKALGIRAAQRKRVADSVAALILLERYRNG